MSYGHRLDAKVDFAREILFQIVDDDRLAVLRENFVLKGAGAILLGYHGTRASKNDLDFGLRASAPLTDDLVNILLEDLEDWTARLDTTRASPVEHFMDGSANIHLAFQHPETLVQGFFQLQISAREGTVPPRLLSKVRDAVMQTYDGHEFSFAVLGAEEIVVEKMLRMFRTDKTPRLEDAFDIGWLAANIGMDADIIRREFWEAVEVEPYCSVDSVALVDLRRRNVAAAYAGRTDFGELSAAEIVITAEAGIKAVQRLIA